MAERAHGSYARYKLDHCRCYACCFAASDYNRHRERAIAYGTWRPYVDAEPARARLRELSEAGIGWRRAADLAGVSRSTVSKLLYGTPRNPPSAGIRPETAEKILAVLPAAESRAAHTVVDATGTVRRLKSLVARGWPQARLAAELGIEPGNFGAVLERGQVLAVTARAVAELYRRLENADPVEHGVSVRSRSRAANHAARNGWPLPAMWCDDTIDDPAAFPDWTGECGTPAGYSLHSIRRIPYCEPCRTAKREQREAGKPGRTGELIGGVR